MKAILYWLETNSSRAWMIARLWLFALHHSVTHHVCPTSPGQRTPSCFKASPRTKPFSQSSVHYQGINVLHVFSSSFFFPSQIKKSLSISTSLNILNQVQAGMPCQKNIFCCIFSCLGVGMWMFVKYFSKYFLCVLNFPMTSSSYDTLWFSLQWTTGVAENNGLGEGGGQLLSIAVFVYHLIYNTVPSASHNQLKDGRAGEAPHQSQKFTSKGRDAFEDLPHPWKSSPRMQGQI